MKHITATEAKAKFSEVLNAVEQGETVLITRHGQVIARIQPSEDISQARAREAMERILERRKNARPASVEEILQWRDEGRR